MATTDMDSPSLLLTEQLDELPGHINSVLIQLGKLFRHQARPELKVIERQKFQAHEALAKITRQFHESLDEVENEILNAKSVMDRDLNKIRAKRIERENAHRAAMSKADVAEDMVQNQDMAMQDYTGGPNGEGIDPDQTLVDLDVDHTILDPNKPHAFDSQDVQADPQHSQGLKDISLDDDDLFGGETDAFGPDNGETNFDFTTGGDFDMDFSMPSETTNPIVSNTQTIPDPIVSTDTTAPENLADNDLLLHDFGDVNATNDIHTNGFGDIDFDHVNTGQDDTTNNNNPFGSINTDDDDFSFFDV